MRSTRASLFPTVFFTLLLCSANYLYGQHEQQIRVVDDGAYSRKFFLQLRSVFGRFRDSDLQRAFDKAQPIECSELINDSGDWRTVAFFNENRDLGDWYRSSLEEVKTDLSAFIFKGACRGDHGPVQLTTKFPVTETVDAFNQGRLQLNQVEVNVNAPVRAVFDAQTQSYSFDLPYLFLVSQQDDQSLYSLAPPRLAEREKYATNVVDHWDCKSVTAENVTYQFLLCRTSTLPRNPVERRSLRTPAFGASAYFILSDGKEASASVKLSVSDADDVAHSVDDLSPSVADSAAAPAKWGTPDSDERLLDIFRDEFRLRFNPQSWAGRLNSAQVLWARQLATLASSNPPSGADTCVWLPGSMSSPEDPVTYSVRVHEQDAQSPLSIILDFQAATGSRSGQLQCFFPRAASAGSLTFGRWTSIVGSNINLEVRP